MAKKQKFAPEGEAGQAAQAIEVAQTATETNGETQPAVPAVPAKPQVYLQHSDGTQYQLVRRPNLPKRAGKAPDGDLKIMLDGVETPVWVTSSKGWSAADKVIDYIWVDTPAGDRGFLTLDYLVPASTFANAEFTIGQGKANRADPARVPGKPDVEENRKDLFQKAMAKKKLEAPAEGETQTEGETTEGEAAAS
jgi:hypothetical protein